MDFSSTASKRFHPSQRVFAPSSPLVASGTPGPGGSKMLVLKRAYHACPTGVGTEVGVQVMILSPTFIPFLGVADDGAATHAGSLLLRAPAHVGEAFAFAVGHGVVARAGAARRDKAVLRRVGEGAIFACDFVMATQCQSRNVTCGAHFLHQIGDRTCP